MIDATERYEQLAKQFAKDTGLMAPGKDAPAAVGNDPHYDLTHRQQEWDKWLRNRQADRLSDLHQELEAERMALANEANRQAYEEEMENAQRDTAGGYRYI